MRNWLIQKCREGFGEAVKSLFKNAFMWSFVVFFGLLGTIYLVARNQLGYKVTLAFTVGQAILVTFCLALLVIFLHVIIRLVRRRRTSANYCSDVIGGIIWEWDAEFDILSPENFLIPLCPKCQCELDISEGWTPEKRLIEFEGVEGSHILETILKCPLCGFKYWKNGEKPAVLSFVVREIERRTRTGEYTKAIRKQKADTQAERKD